MVEHEIIREIKPMGQLSLYETRTGDNHHHIICKSCDRVMDANCTGNPPCLKPENDYGFVIEEAEVIFWGICPSCKKSLNKNKKGARNAKI